MSKKVERFLNILFWGAVGACSLYTIKTTVDELRDPVEKEKRKEQRREACSLFDKIIDKIGDITKKAYKQIANWDEAIDNAIPAYKPEHTKTRVALLKAKREKLDARIAELEELEKNTENPEA